MDGNTVITQLHIAVANYKMPLEARNVIGSGEVTVLCGVTAAGKNTIANYLVQRGDYAHVVSHTTRKPRENGGVMEISGREYWFVSPEQMLTMVQNNEFVEVKSIHGDTCYGTSIQSIKTVIGNRLHPVMEIDVQGVLELTSVVASLRPLFILPPSYEVWMERLGTRGNLSDGEKARRLHSAATEIETALSHSAFILVVNHEVELTAQDIMRGIDTSTNAQLTNRQLALDLLEAINNK